MKKRLIPLFVVVLLLTTASSALATHCQLCHRDRDTGELFCRTTTALPGHTWCVSDGATCQSSGISCSPHGFAPELASEFVVVSVERLDEAPQPAPDESLVATRELPSTR